MDHFPLITVVIPLYNGAQYIRRSIQSVLQQSYTAFELIVVDDGSVDCGGEVVLEFSDPRLRLVRQANMGVSAARNKGIAEGSGKYIAFLDADDEWDVWFLDAVVTLSNIYPQAGIYGTGYRLVFPKGPGVEVTVVEATNRETSLLVTDYFYRTNGGNFINASGVMIPRRIFEELEAFKIGEHQGEDVEMWVRIALRYPIGYDTRILFSFHQTSMVNKRRFKKLPQYNPTVKMLQGALLVCPDTLVNKEMISYYIKKYLTKMCFWFIITNNRRATIEYMHNSNAAFWNPLLNRLINVPPLWPFLRLLALIFRCAKSRVVMRIIGGHRVSHGVLEMLQGANRDA